MDAMNRGDYRTLREISNFFYKTSGIYNRLCRYMAYMYKYDWLVTPYINSDSVKQDKLLDGFNKVLLYLDNFGVKKFFGEVALKVIKNGCYYGYIIETDDRTLIQELPVGYCRSRYAGPDGRPVVEFSMKFFDEMFRDTEYRMRILDLFPKEFKKGYILYKQGKLPLDFQGDTRGWYMLDPDYAIKFNINGDDFPAFAAVIPAIIDLDEAQDLDRKKMQQNLLKIIIQKMPLDKNNEMVFDPDEAQEMHSNAVRMLSRAIGVDVLTTFADVDVADMSDTVSSTSTDQLEKIERAVYNEAGVSQMQFNTDGNLALQYSELNDEATLRNLIQQFEVFLQRLLQRFNTSPKKIYYRVEILETTIYNHRELAKLYKEQAQLGYSKMKVPVALGQSQSSVLATAYFENDILNLSQVFTPLMQSSTMNADALNNKSGTNKTSSSSSTTTTKTDEDAAKGGRPEKEDSEKSEKTIQNKESQS